MFSYNTLVKIIIFLTITSFSSLENETSSSISNMNESTTTFTTPTLSKEELTASTQENETEDYSSATISQFTSSTKKTNHGNDSIDEVINSEERPWWFKDAIRDIAYYLRSHKFNEYDRRYNRNGSQVERTNFQYFPRPPLRALHWEVHKYCDSSFLLCVDYLKKKLKHVSLKRQDDTSIVVQENKWGSNETKKMSQIDMECRRMRNIDDTVAPPFEGPLERYQWRTTASYFMCWYTMNEVPELKHLEENCDNFAYCLDFSVGPSNHDPRANDSIPFACAQYSFCPDSCCANKHLEQMDSCWNDEKNPCFYENSAGQRECLFNRTQNTEFTDLILNRWNVTCKCPKPGYEWSSLYGICVDINECNIPKSHGCTSEGQACMNLPGSFTCICRWGYIYSEKEKKCIASEALSDIKLSSQQKKKNETRNMWKVFMKTVVRVLGKSSSSRISSIIETTVTKIIFFVLVLICY